MTGFTSILPFFTNKKKSGHSESRLLTCQENCSIRRNMKDAIYSTKQISQHQKVRIPHKPLPGQQDILFDHGSAKEQGNHSKGLLLFFLFLEVMKSGILF